MKTLYGNYQRPKFHALELGAKKKLSKIFINYMELNTMTTYREQKYITNKNKINEITNALFKSTQWVQMKTLQQRMMNIMNKKEVEKNGVNEAFLANHYGDKELQHCNKH
jgi:hypothetical protein